MNVAGSKRVVALRGRAQRRASAASRSGATVAWPRRSHALRGPRLALSVASADRAVLGARAAHVCSLAGHVSAFADLAAPFDLSTVAGVSAHIGQLSAKFLSPLADVSCPFDLPTVLDAADSAIFSVRRAARSARVERLVHAGIGAAPRFHAVSAERPTGGE
jgi:hypothetical protein